MNFTTPLISEDVQRTLIYDVVIIGAGASGLAAAVSAAEEGVKVALLEQKSTFSAYGGDNTALNSKIHRKLGIHIDVEEVIRRLMEISGFRADEKIIRLWAYNCGKVMDWLIDLCAEQGVKAWLVIPDRRDEHTFVIDAWPPSHAPPGWSYKNDIHTEYPTCHRFGDTPRQNQRLFLSVLENKAMKLGVDIQYGTKALKLEKGQDGRVTGVIARDKNGSYVKFQARKGIIISTGDYSDNKAMVEKFLPEEYVKLRTLRRDETAMGDGHIMAHSIGAQMEPKPHGAMTHMHHVLGTAPFLMVDKFGKRFANEDIMLNMVAFTVQCIRVKGIWVIFDSNWPKYVWKLGPGFRRVWKADDITLNEFRKKVELGEVLEASTIDKLAQSMQKITPELHITTFKATVVRYNELCARGIDEDFGKKSDRLFPVDTPPFYAHWNKPENSPLIVTLGGLITDENLQPLDQNGKPILGLYCTGNVVGRKFGIDYPTICPGLSHSMAWTTGYLAGKYAAKGITNAK